MSPLPAKFLFNLSNQGYHPRSDKHSNALAEAIVASLVEYCATINARAAKGELVYCLNFALFAGTSEWNVDRVLGPPAGQAEAPEPGQPIRRQCPATVHVAMDNMNGPVCYMTERPAPQVGDPPHHDAFIQSLCDCYTRRF